MIVAELSITPLETGDTSRVVDLAIDVIRRSGLRYEVGPLGTSVEGERDEVFRVLKAAHEAAVREGTGRVVTEIRIDDRGDSNVTIAREVERYRMYRPRGGA